LADNVELDAGSGGDTVRAEEKAGAKTQVILIDLGGTSTESLLSTANPMPVSDNGGSLTVDGSVTVSGTATVSGTVAATQSGTWTVTGAGGTFPVTDSGGSLTVDNNGTFAVQAAQSGTWTVQPGNTPNTSPWLVSIHDGTNKASVADLTNSNPLHVAIVDGSGTQITSFGGGTQYTEGDTDASVTGTAVMWEDTSDTLRVASAAKPLPVAIISGAGSGGTASDDDADFTPGTTAGTPAMGVYESSPTSVTDNDMGIVGITQTRALRTVVEGTVTVGSHAVTNAGTFAVQVSSQVPGTGATNLGKAEDAAHSSGDTGVFVLAVRSDTAAATGQTDGDYTALVTDSSGRLHVNVGNTVTVGSHAVTNAGTFAVQVDGSALTALQLIDDIVYVDDADFTDDTSKFALTGGVYQSAPQTVTDGDVAPFLIDVNGRMQVATHAVTQSGTWNIGTVTTVTTVSTVTNVATIGTSVVPGTGATHLGKAEDAAHSSGDTGVFVLAVRSDTAAATGQSDGDYTALVTDSTGRLH
jgi:hypothetical protein